MRCENTFLLFSRICVHPRRFFECVRRLIAVSKVKTKMLTIFLGCRTLRGWLRLLVWDRDEILKQDFPFSVSLLQRCFFRLKVFFRFSDACIQYSVHLNLLRSIFQKFGTWLRYEWEKSLVFFSIFHNTPEGNLKYVPTRGLIRLDSADSLREVFLSHFSQSYLGILEFQRQIIWVFIRVNLTWLRFFGFWRYFGSISKVHRFK